jgi:hypothetical protein
MKKSIVLLALAVIGISCSDDSNLPDASFVDTPRVVGFLKTTQNVPFFEDEGVVLKEFPFDIMGTGDGSPYNEDVTLTYSVNTVATTAVAGVEYDWVSTGSSVVIPAGQSFGLLPLNINTGNFNPTAKTSLVLDITAVDQEGFVISSQNKQLTINFIGCLSEVQGLYTVVVTRGDGVTATYTNETVDLVDVNYFKTRTTGTWAAGTIAPDQGYNFTDICGDISVASQGLAQGYYSNTVKGLTTDGTDGEVLNANQFKVTYEISFAAGNQTYTNVYTRAN